MQPLPFRAQVQAGEVPPPHIGTERPAISSSQGTRIVVVEWKIRKGSEQAFLDYWSTRSTIPDRSGLIGEFLSEIDGRFWLNWTISAAWTTFYNVGIWRDAADFEDQIGQYLDDNQPLLEFEAARRSRVFLAPERWRIGASPLPAADPLGVN